MRVLLGLFVSVIVISPVCAGPLQDDREEAIYRGQPASYWISRLKATDWPTRLDGASGLRAAGAKAWPAVPALMDALHDDDPDVRFMVIKALGSIGFGAEKALPRLAGFYQQAKGSERLNVLTSMLRIDVRSAQTMRVLRDALQEADPEIRDYALQCSVWVPNLEEKEILAVARASLSHRCEQLRTTASSVLIYLGATARPALLELLEGEDQTARAEAVEILTRNGNLDAEMVRKLVPVLGKMLGEEDRNHRRLACVKLEDLGRAGAATAGILKVALKDEDAEVRLHAATALVAVASGADAEVAVPLLVKFAGEDDKDALTALGRIGPVDPSIVPALIDALTRTSANREVKYAAAVALRNIGPRAKAHIPELQRHLNDKTDKDTRTYIADTLVAMGSCDEETLQAVLQGFTGTQGDLNRLGLLARSSEAARDRLIECLKSANSDIVRRGRGAPGYRYDPKATLALAELLELGPALRPARSELVELLNGDNPYAQVMAYYFFKAHDPELIARAEQTLLEGDTPPNRDGKTLGQWLEQARHHDVHKRSEALRQLATFAYPRIVVPALLDRLDDEDLDLGKEAAKILSDYPAACDFMLAAVARGDRNIKSRLLDRVLPASDPEGPVFGRLHGPMSHFLIDDGDPFVRLLAAYALREGHSLMDARCLIEAMKQERAVRPAGARLLAAVYDGQGGVRSMNKAGDQAHIALTTILPVLLEMTREGDLEQCCAGVRALLSIAPDSEEVLSAVARMMTRKEAAVRRVTAQGLGRKEFQETTNLPWHRSGLEPSRPEDAPRHRALARMLVDLLQDPVPEVRAAAARSAGNLELNGDSIVAALRRSLADECTPVRVAAAFALWQVDADRGTTAAVEVLRTVLKDPDAEQRLAAVGALANIGNAARCAFADVAALARSDRGRLLDDAPLMALPRLDASPTAMAPLLIEFLKDSGRQDRATIAGLIGREFAEPCHASAVPLLAELIFDEDAEVRAMAVKSLHDIGPAARAAVPALLDRLRQDQFKNDECLDALYAIVWENPPAKEVVAFLLQQVQDPHSPALEACVYVLPSLGSEAEALLPYLVRQAESGRLGKGDFVDIFDRLTLTEKSVPELQKMLTSRFIYHRSLACFALRKLGPRAAESIPALKLLVEDEYCGVATFACCALLAIEGNPSRETKRALPHRSASDIVGLVRGDEWPHVKKNLVRFGPEFNQVLQVLVEDMRGNDRRRRDIDMYEVLQFVAEMGQQAGYFLPELLELQRDEAYPFSSGQMSYDDVLSGKYAVVFWNSEAQPNGSPVTCNVRLDDAVAALQKYLRTQAKAALPHLARYLQDPDPKVRIFAALCSGLLGPQAQEVSKELRAALNDRNGFPEDKKSFDRLEVFYLAEVLQALVAVGPPKESTKDFAACLKHKSPMIRATAVWALSQPGLDAQEARTALAGIAGEADSKVFLQVALARLRLGGNEDKAVQDVCRFLEDDRPEVRQQAAVALCRLGRAARSSMDTFRKWAKSGDPGKRLLAAEAYWAIAGETQAAVSLCIGILDDGAGYPESVVELLNRIGPAAQPARAAVKDRAQDRYRERFNNPIYR